MSNNRPSFRTILTTVSLLLVLLLVMAVWSDESSAGSPLFQQTWPTRTPTSPPSNPPTQPPPGGQPGGTIAPPEPGATATIAPDTTPTAVNLANTPVGGYIATAEPCGLPPTILALAGVNVREGPGIDYDVVATLVYLEVRPIIGRAADSAWWLIELPEDSEGWVFDQAVVVNGYTTNVPVVSPPPINGQTPTPGAEWQPTPNPACTPLPTNTATPTLEPTSTPSIEEPTQAATATDVPPTPTSSPTPTDVPPTETASPEPTNTAEPTAEPASPNSEPTAESEAEDSIPLDDSGSGGSSWLLIGGLGLVVAGLVIAFIRRR